MLDRSPMQASSFDSVAERWDTEHGPASSRATEFAARIRYLRRLCQDLQWPSALDLGCGTGRTLLHLADVIGFGTGVDVSPAMISRARRNADCAHFRFLVGDAVEFCVNCPDRFELVLLIGVLEHLADQAAALAGVERVLTASGRLVIVSPHPWNPAFRAKRFIDGGADLPADHLSPLRLRRLALSHGLELSAISALPYAPWSALRVASGNRPGDSRHRARVDPLAGLVRGAFAAEFRHRSIAS
jgi:SAM-dependent methyltransferase